MSGLRLTYTFDTHEQRADTALLDGLKAAGIAFRDLQTSQSSLEEIFVNWLKVRQKAVLSGRWNLNFYGV